MNPYVMLGSGFATNEATTLSARLSAWHDAMVAHERGLRAGRTEDSCNDECPHAEARALWSEAVATFGPRAQEVTFLRSRANASACQSHAGPAAREPMSEAADAGHGSRRTREPQGRTALAAWSGAARAVVELWS
jgi:hypothetical protein